MADTSFGEPKLQRLLERIAHDEGFNQPAFAISVGSNPGDNFTGRIYRVVITEADSSKTLSLIFKVSPLSKFRRETMSSDELFAAEGRVYQIVLPALNDFMKKHGVVNSSTFPGTARCLAVEEADNSDPNDVYVLVLEDKSFDGFQMASERKKGGLDVHHIRLALEYLAYWHASSLALYHKEPKTAEKLWKAIDVPELWFSNEKHPLLDDLGPGVLASLDMLKEPYRKGDPVFNKLEKLSKNFNSEFVKLNKFTRDLPCIIHGDSWFNNFLFKYNEEGTVQDICLIDLQLSRVCSPVNDLLLLIYVCTSKETRDAHYEDLIRFYHNKVSSILKGLGCDPEQVMPWELLQEHLRLYGMMGVFIAMVGLPIFLTESSDVLFDMHSANNEKNAFVGSAKITDPEKLEALSKRMTDVIHDAARLGQIY